ncbi:MAG: pyrimidine 5'-nucleotidase [Rhodocyclaceae bacterium]|nr:pyrimidine 5'-nucleotidase [Rhodocyclaceae bacterium]MBX3670325.1 pyrimidine 5'-nucleotidase [Rhodocyclaceae bacterium]
MPPDQAGARRRRVWVFDLDNTLHNASPHIFPHINRSMTAYVAERLGLDEAAASALRVQYWRQYGATMLGLRQRHGIDPHHFLWHTHQFERLADMVVAERALDHCLARLPGRKVVFSNAPGHYAEAVLEALGVARRFERVMCIEHMRYQPKPQPAAFRHLLAQVGVPAARCVLVEDSDENLRAAKRLGMRTVWVTRSRRRPAYVDVKLASILDLPRHAYLVD